VKIVDITGLIKKFNSVAAVDNINLEIEEGEIFGFLGPNGAGKSTTIHLICGLLAPDKGKIAVIGKEVKNIPVSPSEISELYPRILQFMRI
jgi:ABC-2 type transport system ATP-binding protein